MKSTHNITIQGQKGGSQSSSYTPVEQSDDLLSDAKLKMLVAVCEGETEGAVTAQQIYLNDTVLANEDGTYNFTGVNWEFRNGTQDQEYIQGMPEIDNELSVGVAVTTSSPWTHQFTDTSLDAIRIKLSLPAQYQYKDNGDMVGTVTEYAIDLSTDGGSYETVVSDKFDGKTTSEYQRDHRINLTRGGTTWAIRVRRITADSTSTKLVNAFKVYSYAEVVDSKLRYPNTALLYVEVDAGQFTSGAPKVTVKMKGKLIRVPDNYDPDTREYTGTWDGSFKMAYSNNPAWVFYDIILDKISGMGNRIDASMIDKWELYQIAEYCDEMVSDGAGGKEPRFTCNAYVQSQEDAFTVLQDFAAIFRGITFWGNSQIIVSADAPVDGPEWTYTAANVVDGLFSYAGGSYKNRYTSCLVSYSDPQNHYSDTTEAVYDADLLSRYGVQQMSLTAIGCTSQSEAHRRGRWALLSNAKDGTVSFSVGLDGHIPLPASIIGVADPYRAGKTNGGRISSVSGLNLTLDRAITFGAGDRLIVNLPDGTAQTRTIAGVSDDKKTVTVSTAFKTTPVAGAVWIIDSDNLAIQQFRVTSITDNDDGTFTVAAVQYDPDKYSYIDDGVMVESAPVTVTPATVMSAPGNITVNEVSHTSQGISLSSLQVAWDAVKGAVKYSAQWRRDSGEWINAGSVSSQGFTVNNIYAGIYEVRVRSVNSSGVSSPWGASDAVTLTGKQGKPPVPLSLTASDNTVFGIDLSWTFGDGSDDGLKTTLMVSTLSDHSDETLLADIPYPQSTYSLTGLASGVARYFRAAFTDKSGNQSEWTDYVTGQSSSNASDVLSYISGEISKTDLGKDLTTEIDAKADQSTVQQQISDASQQAQAAIDKATESSNSAISDANKAIEQANNAISTEIGDRIAAVQSEASARADALLNEENARKADINTVQTLIQNDSESLAQQIAQVAAGTGEQFDPYKIWYFDDKSVDGWSGNGDPTVTDDGWLKPADSDSEFATSPSGLGINGMAYQFIKARLKKVGSPEWVGEILWKDQSGDFSNQQSMVVTEPEYDENNIATLTVHDIPWQSMTVDQFRLNLTSSQSDDNYIIFDWISVGRPTPGAGMAALQQEQTARVEADAAEATNRNTLAAQLRGPYTGTDAGQVTSGLIYSEQQLRISGDKAEATARQALETKLDNSVSEIDQTMDTLNTATQANANDISNLKSSLQTTNNNVAQKADASALQATQSTVSSQGNTLTSQGNQIASLQAGITQGANLVPNPGMAGNASGWSFDSMGTDGSRVYVAASWEYAPNSAQFPVAAGDVLTISAELWTDSGSAISLRIRYDGPDMTNNASAVYQNNSPSTGSWFTATGKSTVPDGATTAQIQMNHPSGTARLSNPVVTLQVASADALNSLSLTVKNQGDTISSQGNQITNLQNSVAGKADSSAVSSLSSTVSSQGNTISSQGNQLTSLQNSVEGKADSSAVSSLSNTVSSQGDAISNQSSEITALNASLSNGANLVPNPGMSSDGAGWSYSSLGTDGERTYVAANYNYAPNSQQFSVNVGDTLICSADLWTDTAMNITFRIRFDGPGVSNVAVGVASENLSANSWQTLSGSVVVPDGASLAQIQVTHDSGTARIANPSVFAQPVSVSAFNSLTATVSQQGSNLSNQAQSISELSSQTGSNSSAIQDTKTAVSSLQETVSATWSLKVQTDSNGNKTVAGIGLSSDSGNGSQFLVQADRFAMITGTNGNITSPFVVSGGQTYIQSAMIQDASIGSAKISDLQSDNYSGGTAGWKITKDGTAEFNDVTVRGHIYASQGSIDNVTIGEDCTIEGKLSANNIDGDVSKMFYLQKGSTITIPATSIDRIIAIPTIYVFASAFVNPSTLHVTDYSCNARIQVNGSDVYTVSADSGKAYSITANHFDLNVQSYSFSLAAGQSCTIGYAYYQPSVNMTRLMDYLMVVASKA